MTGSGAAAFSALAGAARAPSRQAVLLAAFLLASAAAGAESAYVIDKLLVGVHEKPSLESAIVKVLPTGSALEVLERAGDMTQVRGEGVEGWVDSAYLMSEKPAALRLAALEQEIAALRSGAGPDVDSLARENTELKGLLADERMKARDLGSQLAELRETAKLPGADAGATEAGLREEIAALNEDKLALERELENTLLQARRARGDAAAAALGLEGIRPSAPAIAVFILIIAAAFGAGVYVMDYLQRRRHGGFRI
jgi:SH3 domain protein